MRFYSLEIFPSLSEILFTQTGSEVYLTSCFIACLVTSSLLESGCRFVMSWSKTLFSLYPPSSLLSVFFPRLRIHMDSFSHLVVLSASWSIYDPSSSPNKKNEAKKFDGRKFTRSKASIPSDYTFESAVAEHSVLENHVIVIVTYKLICSISRNKLDKHDVTFCCHVSQVMFTWLVQVLWVQRGQRGQPLSPLHSEILNVKIKM